MSYKENMAFIKKDMCMTNNLDIIKLLIEEGMGINEYGIGGILLFIFT
jgi:hypothetical protein